MEFLRVYMSVKIMSIPELESHLSLRLSTCLLNKSAGRKAVATIIIRSRGIHSRRQCQDQGSCSLEWWMKDSGYCWNSGKICTVVMINEVVTLCLGRNDWQKRVLFSHSLKNPRSFSNSLAAWKKIILDSSGSQEWGERIVKDHRIAPENRIMSPVSKKKKKVLMLRTFLWITMLERPCSQFKNLNF